MNKLSRRPETQGNYLEIEYSLRYDGRWRYTVQYGDDSLDPYIFRGDLIHFDQLEDLVSFVRQFYEQLEPHIQAGGQTEPMGLPIDRQAEAQR